MNINAIYLTCPRCLGSGIQRADNGREGETGSFGGTVLHNLKEGRCEFCDGVGKIEVGGFLPAPQNR